MWWYQCAVLFRSWISEWGWGFVIFLQSKQQIKQASYAYLGTPRLTVARLDRKIMTDQ